MPNLASMFEDKPAEPVAQEQKNSLDKKIIAELQRLIAVLEDMAKAEAMSSGIKHINGETTKRYDALMNKMDFYEKASKAEFTDAEKVNFVQDALKDIEKLPKVLQKIFTNKLPKKDFLAREINGEPNAVLPILAELRDVYTNILFHMRKNGRQEFPYKEPKEVFVPNMTLASVCAVVGIASALIMLHGAKLSKASEAAPKDIVKEALVITVDEKNPNEGEVSWVNKLNGYKEPPKKVIFENAMETGVVARTMTSKAEIANDEYALMVAVGVLTSIGSLAALIFSFVCGQKETRYPKDVFSKIDNKLEKQRSGHLSNYLAERDTSEIASIRS